MSASSERARAGRGNTTRAGVTRRRFLALSASALVSSLAAALLPGCSSSSPSSGGGGKMHVVTDSVGREVELPSEPERIAGLDSFAGELMVMCGAGPRLVATPAGVASDELLRGLYPGLEDVPAPMTSGTVNMEELMACDPDAVLVKQDVYETAGQRELLDAMGVPYAVVGFASMDGQIEAMELVGSVCGGDADGNVGRLVEYYRGVIEECEERAQVLSEGDRVRVYHSINALVATDGAQSLGQDWITRVGAVDVSAEDASAAPGSDYEATLEQILAWDPDVFVCNSADTTEYLLSKDSCAGLTAVKEGRCHTIPVGATRWGQAGSVETYLAMLWLGCTVYPKLYEDVDLEERVTSYYADYLGIDVDHELYEQMLSGEGLRQQSAQAD